MASPGTSSCPCPAGTPTVKSVGVQAWPPCLVHDPWLAFPDSPRRVSRWHGGAPTYAGVPPRHPPSTPISTLRATPQHGSHGAALQTSLHGHKRLNGVGVTSCCVGDYGAPNRSPPRVPPHLGVGQGGCRGDTGESEQQTSGLLEIDLENHVAKPTQRPPSPHPAVGGRGSLGGRCWGGVCPASQRQAWKQPDLPLSVRPTSQGPDGPGLAGVTHATPARGRRRDRPGVPGAAPQLWETEVSRGLVQMEASRGQAAGQQGRQLQAGGGLRR